MRLFVFFLSTAVFWVIAQETNTGATFKQEELEQILAPVALYPDSLLSQVLMASTYPLEVVQAQRWVEQNVSLTGDALTAELEKQTWDPSVKSIVDFKQVLTMMSEKLDWTQKLGDAFLAQQKDVMNTIQSLRKKAQQAGNLESTDKQTVKVEQETIVIEYADPKVVYVPTYDPVVVYGTWPYPAYPPYYYYPPGYYPGAPWVYFSCGVAWGYAWGSCDWDDCDIDIDIDHNHDFNDKIDRDKYVEHFKNSGRLEDRKGKWRHNPENRRGVAYRDQATAGKFNKASSMDAVKSREEFRGRAEQGRQDLTRGNIQSPDRLTTRDVVSGSVSNRGGTSGNAPVGSGNIGAVRPPSSFGGTNRPGTLDNVNRGSAIRPPSSISNRGGAFDGVNQGSAVRNYSNRGAASRQSMSRPGGGMGGGRMGGAGRGGRR